MSDSVTGVTLQGETRSIERVRKSFARVLIIVENLPSPFDRRVWQEARTLTGAGYQVSIICPKAPGYEKSFEEIDGIDIGFPPRPTARWAMRWNTASHCSWNSGSH